MRTFLAAVLLAALATGCAPAGAPTSSAPAVEADLAIVGATVIHPEREGAAAVERDATILMRGNRIAAVGRGVDVPPGTQTIDARGKWVIPGLVDSHVHFFQSSNLYTHPDAADFNPVVRYTDETARNKARLRSRFAPGSRAASPAWPTWAARSGISPCATPRR